MHIQRHILHKHALLTIFSAVAVVLSSACTQDNAPEPPIWNEPGERAVTFETYEASRAGVSNIETLKDSGFGVFASLTRDMDFQDKPAEGATGPNYMYNRKVEWQTQRGGGWSYEPVLLWPGGQKVSFFAYVPYSAAGVSSAIKAISAPDSKGSPRLSFAIGKDIKSQVDLLYASALNLIDGPVVHLSFKHALSRININLYYDEFDRYTTVTLNRLSFMSSEIGTEGMLNLMTGEWENVSGTTAYDFKSQEALKESILIIPTGKEVGIEVSADFTVRTADSKLDAGYFECKNVTTTPLNVKFEAGKAYNLNVRVSLQSVSLDAELTSWPDEDHKWENDHDKTE